jgi:hypothetical protein
MLGFSSNTLHAYIQKHKKNENQWKVKVRREEGNEEKERGVEEER